MQELVGLDELKEAARDMKSDKSLGLDGFPIEYFVCFMDLYKDDLLATMEESKVKGIIIVAFNATFIDLIPKVEQSTSF